jgi:hypothetical protein
MKKLSFLLIAFALVTFVSINACKTATEPAAEADVVETVVEEAVPADSAAAVVTEDVAVEEAEAAE